MSSASNPHPGQRAYEAYITALPVRAGWTAIAWHRLDVVVQDAWEAAAQAVLAQPPGVVCQKGDAS